MNSVRFKIGLRLCAMALILVSTARVFAGAENLAVYEPQNAKAAQVYNTCKNEQGDIFSVITYMVNDVVYSELTVFANGANVLKTLVKTQDISLSRCHFENGKLFVSGRKTLQEIAYTIVFEVSIKDSALKELFAGEGRGAFVVSGSVEKDSLLVAHNFTKDDKKSCRILKVNLKDYSFSEIASAESMKVETCSLGDAVLQGTNLIVLGYASQKGGIETPFSVTSLDLGKNWQAVQWFESKNFAYPQQMSSKSDDLYAAFVGEPDAGVFNCSVIKYDFNSFKWIKFNTVKSAGSLICRKPLISAEGIFMLGFGPQNGVTFSQAYFTTSLDKDFTLKDNYSGLAGTGAISNYGLIDDEEALVSLISTKNSGGNSAFILRKIQ